MDESPRGLVLMGVAGSGKTVVGQKAAGVLQCEFLDADDYHPPANVAKMKSGQPLNDQDRQPWLVNLHEELRRRLSQGKSVVLACSALKDSYRQIIGQDLPQVVFIFLHVDRDVVADRLARRTNHFFPKELLDSQFSTLEVPHGAIEVNANLTVDDVVDQVVRAAKQ
jgi:gluconokinase